jgi:DNA-binding NarL/FixJ family response regulator
VAHYDPKIARSLVRDVQRVDSSLTAVAKAVSAKEFIEAANVQQPHIVLLDMQMLRHATPDMVAVCARARHSFVLIVVDDDVENAAERQERMQIAVQYNAGGYLILGIFGNALLHISLKQARTILQTRLFAEEHHHPVHQQESLPPQMQHRTTTSRGQNFALVESAHTQPVEPQSNVRWEQVIRLQTNANYYDVWYWADDDGDDDDYEPKNLRKLVVRKDEVRDMIPAFFVKCHRCHVLNPFQITELHEKYAVMTCGTKVYCSRDFSKRANKLVHISHVQQKVLRGLMKRQRCFSAEKTEKPYKACGGVARLYI